MRRWLPARRAARLSPCSITARLAEGGRACCFCIHLLLLLPLSTYLSAVWLGCMSAAQWNSAVIGPGGDGAQRNTKVQEPKSAKLWCVCPSLAAPQDGTPFWNCLHVAPVRDADGRVQFLAGVQLDLTAGQGGAAADGPVTAVRAVAEESKTVALEGSRGQQQQQAAEGRSGGAEQAAAAAVEERRPGEGAGAAPPLRAAEPSPWLLLQQKGVVGAVRVATRALAAHGLRRDPSFQRTPSGEGEGS